MGKKEFSIDKAIEKHGGRAVIMIELPTESYFELNSASIKHLTNKGFEGIYISFQRPFQNISSLLLQQGTDIKKLFFIDATASNTMLEERDLRCIRISQNIEIDELVRAIYTSLPRLGSKKKFIFIDSLTTIALYKPLSEIMRFSEFLIRIIRREEQNVSLIFNVAKDLSEKKFIKDIALHVDEIITLG